MKRIFITGVSGYFGSKLVEHLGGKDDIGEIFGIDINPPKRTSPKLTFIHHDVRADMYPLLKDKGIDWAIHAAYILPPLHDKGLMEDININGTKNFLSSCLKAGMSSSSSAPPPLPTGSIRTMTCRSRKRALCAAMPTSPMPRTSGSLKGSVRIPEGTP